MGKGRKYRCFGKRAGLCTSPCYWMLLHLGMCLKRSLVTDIDLKIQLLSLSSPGLHWSWQSRDGMGRSVARERCCPKPPGQHPAPRRSCVWSSRCKNKVGRPLLPEKTTAAAAAEPMQGWSPGWQAACAVGADPRRPADPGARCPGCGEQGARWRCVRAAWRLSSGQINVGLVKGRRERGGGEKTIKQESQKNNRGHVPLGNSRCSTMGYRLTMKGANCCKRHEPAQFSNHLMPLFSSDPANVWASRAVTWHSFYVFKSQASQNNWTGVTMAMLIIAL